MLFDPSRTGGNPMPYRVIINPQSDGVFAAEVKRLATAAINTVEELRELLRPQYPSVQVRNGVADPDGTHRWYVYRDGQWRRNNGD